MERADANGERGPGDVPGPIWAGSAGAPRPALAGDLTVDVAVIGAGIVGLTTALEVARAGRTVAVLEARRIGEGTTGRSTAKVSVLQGDRLSRIRRRHGDRVAATHASAQRGGLSWIRDAVALLDDDCGWEERTACSYSTTGEGAARVEEEAAVARACGLEVEVSPTADLPFPTTRAVSLEGQGQLDPRRYLECLADALDRLPGVVIHEGTRVTAVRGRGPHEVVSDGGTVRSEAVVVATLLPILDRALMFARARPVASHTVALRVNGRLPDGMYLGIDGGGRSLRSAGVGRDRVLLVGGEGSQIATGASPEDAANELVRWASDTFPVGELVGAWTAHDHAPVDHLPWVGPTSPLTPRVLTATGFEKWGLTMGTAAGTILATGILEPSSKPWGIYDPSRFPPSAWPSGLRLGADVAGRLVRDRIHPEDGPDRRGRGRRRRAGLAAVGEDGAGGSVEVTCTHLGGICRWNDLDATWDCPLHGSRFEADGTVLAGPAVEPLRRRPPTTDA